MITAVAARWLLTVVFAAAGLGAALPWRGHHGAADAAGPVPVVSCVVMCVALTAASTGMPPAGPARGAMAVMPHAAAPVPVLAVSSLLAVCCAAACIPWLARAIGPGPRVKDQVSASQAAMSAGMAAMLIATL